MENKNVLNAKKELLRFLKKRKIVAEYTYAVYGDTSNMSTIKKIFERLECASTNNEFVECYINLIGKIRLNMNILDKQYLACVSDSLYQAYLQWEKYIFKKFHVKYK